MNIIYTSITICEKTFSPLIFSIEERNYEFYEYTPAKVSRELIAELQWVNVEDGMNIVKSILEKQTPKLVTLEYLLNKYEHIKDILLPYIRDKKLDELV